MDLCNKWRYLDERLSKLREKLQNTASLVLEALNSVGQKLSDVQRRILAIRETTPYDPVQIEMAENILRRAEAELSTLEWFSNSQTSS